MTSYKRVTYRPEGGRRRSLILEIRGEGDVLLTGLEVTETGEPRWTKAGTTETIHVIDKDLVISRTPMTMDMHYGMLVESDLSA